MPARITFAGREVDKFQRVAVGIAKVKRLDSGCVQIPLRQGLGSSRNRLNVGLEQKGAGGLHVRYDDGDVLKPLIVAFRIGRNGPPPWASGTQLVLCSRSPAQGWRPARWCRTRP